jgi:hypothetical protein
LCEAARKYRDGDNGTEVAVQASDSYRPVQRIQTREIKKMKTAIVLLLSVAAATFAADQSSQPAKGRPSDEPEQVKKLGSVTWDLNAHKLIWVVQKGTMVNDEFVPASEQRYEIAPDEATMAAAGELRGFATTEADGLQKLLDVLSLYCAESVVWWEQGEGTPLGPDGGKPSNRPRNSRPGDKTGEKPVKVGQPQPAKPAYRVPDTDLVAALSQLAPIR